MIQHFVLVFCSGWYLGRSHGWISDIPSHSSYFIFVLSSFNAQVASGQV